MKMVKIIPLTFMLFLLVGCTSQNLFQVVEVGSTNCRSDNNYLLFENDTLRVVYVFWNENGIMRMFIHNKTEYPLYIDWKKCAFIVGDTKNDYWHEGTTITTNGTSSTYGEGKTKASSSSDYWLTNLLGNFVSGTGNKTSKSSSEWFQQTFSSSVTRFDQPERITFIPPHTTISRETYLLETEGLTLSPNYPVLTKDTIISIDIKHHITRSMVLAKFDVFNSPLTFRSFITYSLDEKFLVQSYLDSHFYISRVLEVPPTFESSPSIPNTVNVQNETITWPSPNSFYIYSNHKLRQ